MILVVQIWCEFDDGKKLLELLPSIVWSGPEWFTLRTETGHYKVRPEDVVSVTWREEK